MITRDVNQQFVVPAFVHKARFSGCGAGPGDFTCSTEGGIQAAGATGMGDCSIYFPGFVIDRLGLRESYRSLLIAPVMYGDALTTDENARIHFQGISVGLQTATATGGTWTSYSTGNWVIYQGLWNQTTATSTAVGFYTVVQADAADVLGSVMTTTTSTAATGMGDPSTSTGLSYYAGPGAAFDLSGADRYIRALIRPHFEATGCGIVSAHVSAAAIFGEPDMARPNATAVKRILVTSACAT